MILLTSAFIKTFLVLLILVGMVFLLLSIDHLFTGSFNADQKDADRLREDVDTRDEVIGKRSLFHEFLASGRSRSR